MSINQFTGTATQPQRNRKFCQFNKDQYCIQARVSRSRSDMALETPFSGFNVHVRIPHKPLGACVVLHISLLLMIREHTQ